MLKYSIAIILICCVHLGYIAKADPILEYGVSPPPTVNIPATVNISDLEVRGPSANNSVDSDTYQFGQGGFRGQTTIFNPDVPDAEHFEENVSDDGVNSLLNTVKTAINRVLGLLAFIALCFLLYGGFKILIAGTDDGAVGEAQAIVKNAAYGIIFIALSWIIVTFIFYVASILTEDSDTNTTTNSITSDQIDPSPTQQ